MRFGDVVTAAVLASVMGGSAALAGLDINGPAEVPPPSYTGRQYVDSAGCVFVRAGFGTTVNWVPRVGRDKKQLCGYKPTFQNGEAVLDVARVAPEAAQPAPAAAEPATAPAAVAAAAPQPTAAPVPQPATSKPASPFAPTPFAGAPMATIAQTTTPPRLMAPSAASAAMAAAPVMAPQPAPPAPAASAARAGYASPYVAGASLPAGSVRYHNTLPLPADIAAPVSIVARETVSGAATSCPAGMAVAERYTLSDGRSVVRCGGQAPDPAAFINAAAVPGLVVSGVAPGGYASPYVAGSVGGGAVSAANPAGAPLYGGTGYAASAYAAPLPMATAPMVGGTGYGASAYGYGGGYLPLPAASAPMVGGTGYDLGAAFAPAGMTPQQAYAAASPYQAGAGGRVAPGAVGAGFGTLVPVVVSTKVGPTGYAAAFEDGRLNPYRGPRSYWGDAQQGEIWTNEVPARRVTAKTPARKRIVPVQGYEPMPQYYVSAVSSKSAPVAAQAPVAAAAATTGARYVQVGTFGVAANAEAAKARLSAAGLPVASSRTAKGLVVVLAGPFADAASALGAVRGAGFSDVLLR